MANNGRYTPPVGEMETLNFVSDMSAFAPYSDKHTPKQETALIPRQRIAENGNSDDETAQSFYRAHRDQYIPLSLIIGFATKFVPTNSKLLSKLTEASLARAVKSASETEYLGLPGHRRLQCISFKALGRLKDSLSCPHNGTKIPRIDPILWQTALSSVTGSWQ